MPVKNPNENLKPSKEEEIKKFVNEFIAKYLDGSDEIEAIDKVKLQQYIQKYGSLIKETFMEYGYDLKDLNLYNWLGFRNETQWQEWKRKYIDPLYAKDIIDSISFYPSVRIDIKDLIFEKKIEDYRDGYPIIDKPFFLFKARFAKGSRNIYIIVTKYQNLKIGNDQQLYLRKCDKSKIRQFFRVKENGENAEINLIAKLCKEYDLLDDDYPKEFDERLEKLLEKHEEQPIFFELAAPIKKDDLLKLNLNEVVWLALDAGMNKDEKLLNVMRMHIPIVVPNTNVLKPSEYMPYAPHTIMITSSKPGKTTTAEKITPNVLDRPTVTHLLGSATLHEKLHGVLNGENKPTIYDGIEEFKDENIAQGLLNYMEKGKAKIARGAGILTEGYSTLVFFSNPEREGKYVASLEALLNLLHSNLLGFGSRIGVFVFDPNMKEPTGEGIPSDLEERYNKTIEAIQFYSSHIFTRILKSESVKRWLNSKDNRIINYIEKLDHILKNENLILHDRLATFIEGLKRGWRHLKGGALRLAFMDLINDFIEISENERIPDIYIKHLLLKANEHVDYLISLNLLSFRHISELDERELLKILLESRLGKVMNLCKTYEIFLLWIVAKYVKTHEVGDNISLPLSTLKELYLEIPNEIKLNSRYNSFSKFVSAIEENWLKINSHGSWLGFHIEKIGEDILIRVDDAEWLNFVDEKDLFKFMTKTTATKMTKVNSSEIGQIGHNGLGHENEYTQSDINEENFEQELLLVIPEEPEYCTIDEIMHKLGFSKKDPDYEERLDYVTEKLKDMAFRGEIKALDENFTRFSKPKGGVS